MPTNNPLPKKPGGEEGIREQDKWKDLDSTNGGKMKSVKWQDHKAADIEWNRSPSFPSGFQAVCQQSTNKPIQAIIATH